MTGVARLLASTTLAFVCIAADAENLRDPTVPPVQAGLAINSPAEKSADAQPVATGVIVRSGKAFVVVGTRLYAKGQMLGHARIERITETEIWLREKGTLRKVPQFMGIERRAVASVSVPTGCTTDGSHALPVKRGHRSSKTSPKAAPCVAVQPRGLAP